MPAAAKNIRLIAIIIILPFRPNFILFHVHTQNSPTVMVSAINSLSDRNLHTLYSSSRSWYGRLLCIWVKQAKLYLKAIKITSGLSSFDTNRSNFFLFSLSLYLSLFQFESINDDNGQMANYFNSMMMMILSFTFTAEEQGEGASAREGT